MRPIAAAAPAGMNFPDATRRCPIPAVSSQLPPRDSIDNCSAELKPETRNISAIPGHSTACMSLKVAALLNRVARTDEHAAGAQATDERRDRACFGVAGGASSGDESTGGVVEMGLRIKRSVRQASESWRLRAVVWSSTPSRPSMAPTKKVRGA